MKQHAKRRYRLSYITFKTGSTLREAVHLARTLLVSRNDGRIAGTPSFSNINLGMVNHMRHGRLAADGGQDVYRR